jgi:hypothetical protein
VPHLVLCVNKMDLVDWDKAVYDKIADEFTSFAAKLDAPDLTIIPISALNGDNIASRSDKSPWYEGPSLLHHLEHVHIASDRNLVDVRFPVQYVIRPQSTTVTDYRGYAGQVASGVLKPGDEVMVLPSGLTSTIAGIDTADGPVDEAFPPMSVTVRLADEIDISRGDMICRPHNAPGVAQDIEAMLCWMDETAPLRVGGKYSIKHTTRTARTVVRGLQYRLDVNTLHRDENADQLTLNEIGRVRLRTGGVGVPPPRPRDRLLLVGRLQRRPHHLADRRRQRTPRGRRRGHHLQPAAALVERLTPARTPSRDEPRTPVDAVGHRHLQLGTAPGHHHGQLGAGVLDAVGDQFGHHRAGRMQQLGQPHRRHASPTRLRAMLGASGSGARVTLIRPPSGRRPAIATRAWRTRA